MPKKKNAVSRFIHDTDRFVLIIIGILNIKDLIHLLLQIIL